jgi:proteasome lid subunit RPN8/RPN11
MAFSLPTLLRTALGRPPRLACSPRIWNLGVDELRRRTGGRRESGAFLLGSQNGRTRKIQEFLFYDDVDPHCFDNGIVEFDGNKFGLVWKKCRESKMTVVADVHVHPGHFGQSSTDRHNPMIAEVGHLALIIPDYAARNRLPGKIGVYEYLGARKWRDHSRQGGRILHIGWWPR